MEDPALAENSREQPLRWSRGARCGNTAGQTRPSRHAMFSSNQRPLVAEGSHHFFHGRMPANASIMVSAIFVSCDLVHVGSVGTGFKEAQALQLRKMLGLGEEARFLCK